MKAINGLGSTMMTRRSVLAAASVAGLGLIAGCSSSSESGSAESDSSSSDESGKLAAATDFELDLETGDFTFTANDENVGYYSIRIYRLVDGVESGATLATSDRINGGFTGEASGTLDLSSVKWGSFVADLVGYAPSGTDYESSDAAQVFFNAGVGGILERPELLAMASGNQVELVIDWFTLSDWYYYQFAPQATFTFYSDEALTEVAFEDTVDTNELTGNVDGGDAMLGWGGSVSSAEEGGHLSNGAYSVMSFGDSDDTETESPDVYLSFNNDYYVYTLDPGTYYLTVQGISDYDFIDSSQPSTTLTVVVTDEEPSTTKTESMSELYTDPNYNGTSFFGPAGTMTDRVDLASEQEVTMEVVEG